MQAFEKVWSRVRLAYNCGHCVSERGLQAVLYAELARELPNAHVVVEPCWSANNLRYVPDIAVVQDDTITDVFEIKFTPHTFAKLRKDIGKLLHYGRFTHEFPVAIDPISGRWRPPMQISKQLRRHFVVIANRNAAAVWLESLIKEVPELQANRGSFFHWIGRIGAVDAESQEWLVAAGA